MSNILSKLFMEVNLVATQVLPLSIGTSIYCSREARIALCTSGVLPVCFYEALRAPGPVNACSEALASLGEKTTRMYPRCALLILAEKIDVVARFIYFYYYYYGPDGV